MHLKFCLAVFIGMLALALAARSPTPPSGLTTLVCERPASLAACKKDCRCDGSHQQPDCGHPDCYSNCRCREATPPPPYKKAPTPPPPYQAHAKAKGGSRPRALMEREADAEAFMEFLAERDAMAEAEAEAEAETDTALYGYHFL